MEWILSAQHGVFEAAGQTREFNLVSANDVFSEKVFLVPGRTVQANSTL